MDGVTILAENTYRMCDTTFAAVSIIVVAILSSVMIFISSKTGDKFDFVMASIFGIFAFVLTVYNNVDGYNTIRTEYQVTVDSSVSFQEFFEKYEVVSADGYVYTVIERVSEDATN
jgi:hypothetical protein